MADLLANWLNNEIELSKTVTNFEKDFSNGFLFGELLYKFNQQSNFKEFSKKYYSSRYQLSLNRDNVASKIENFQKLQTTLSNLKVKYDSKLIDGIMKEERGLALRLLYQLKMALEKVYPPTDIAVLRKTGKMGDNQPALKIAHSKDTYDKQQHTFFKMRLQELNKPQKQIDMDKHLQKFDEEQKRQEKLAAMAHQEEMETKDRLKQELRKAQINKLQRNAGFMEEWQQKGAGDWKVNQTIKKERERKQLEFEYKQAEKYNNLTMRKVDDATKEVHEGINQFEQTIRTNYGISTKVEKDQAERAVSESLTNSPFKQSLKAGKLSQSLMGRQTGTMNQLGSLGGTTKFGGMTLTSTGLKTKDKKTVTDQTRKERERRRRKMIVDQAKTHMEMDQSRREVQIVERIKRQAKQEKELTYVDWRTNQYKNVIIENRKLREARYDKRREIDQQTAIWKEEEMLRQQREQMERDQETFKDRDYEMRIVQKQAQREKRTEVAQVLFDAIFDIADEAYQHQQQTDSQDIDQRNWKEWLQLFIDQVPIPGTLKKLAQTDQESTEQVEEASLKLDQMELVDYLKNQGQWQDSLITSIPVNLEQFLTGQLEGAPAAAAAKGAKAPAKAPAAEQIVLEEGDTELPKTCPNNFLLGDAIEMIININYDARPELKRPQMPHFLNLKLCLVGYAFAGKKTQAKKLQEEYGLEVFYINELVQKAIEFSETHPEPIQNIKPVEEGEQFEERMEQEDVVSENSEIQEELNPEEDFRQCGLAAKELLLEGLEISDELYVKLIAAKLRMTFPHKNKKELRDIITQKAQKELELTKQLTDIESELNGESTQLDRSIRRKRKTPEQLAEEAANIRKEIDQLNEVEKNGWVLVDFPSTFAQAKLLETALTGYLPAEECEQVTREKQIEDAYLLVQPTQKESPAILLMKSGIDSVLWFDTKREECIRRALGRRYDSVNDNVYHIQDSPPLTTNAPLCERLTPVDQEEESEATLIDKWMAFDQGSRSLQNWLNKFGIARHELSILNKIDANASEAEVFEAIKSVVEQTLRIKQFEMQQAKEQIKSEILQREEEEQQRLQKQKEEEEEELKKQQEGYEEPKQEQPKVTKPEPATERVGPKEAAITNVDNDFKPVIMNMWQELSTNYKRQMKSVFSQVRGQRERIAEQFHHIQQKFLAFLHRPDIKQEKLDAFIKEFNDFSDQYPDLREDDATKEELHQRVDYLSDELWEIIEERKDQETEERKKIMENGWIESELAFLVTSAQLLMQGEVDKFRSSVQILHDFYHAFEDKLIPELPPMQTVELVQEGEELPPVESLPDGADQFNPDLYTYPRLDTIFSRALKAQVVPDVTQIQATSQDKKGAPPKGGAKDVKKGAEEEKQVEESQYVKDMKAAIKVEKAILRFRLTQIRNWALLKLKEMRSKCLKVYAKLEDWIYVATKTENDAVDEMCVVLKSAIEEQKKIQDELRIKFMDFCVDEKILNFIEPPPEKLPAMEELRPERFSIEELRNLVEELSSLSEQQGGEGKLSNKSVVDFFLRKLENFVNLGDEFGLPEEWKSYNEFNFQTIVRNLDKQNSGYINWRVLATYLCLLKSPIGTEKEVEAFGSELQKVGTKDGYITQELFSKTPAWFDQSEYSQDRDYSIPFPRVQYIKELLFRINKEGERLNIKKLGVLLKAKELTMFKRSFKTYGDVLLLPSDK